MTLKELPIGSFIRPKPGSRLLYRGADGEERVLGPGDELTLQGTTPNGVVYVRVNDDLSLHVITDNEVEPAPIRENTHVVDDS